MSGGSNHKAFKEIKRLRRLAIFKRDEYRCVFCECEVVVGKYATNMATIDHLWPQSMSKSCDSQNNMTTACFTCNQKKGNMRWYEFAEKVGLSKDSLQHRINARKEKRIPWSVWKTVKGLKGYIADK